jgi:bifunctional non-homologous end joining protein LigD
MARLREYRRKRDFGRTPEPSGDGERSGRGAALSFVVQKHVARALHYDFRLELDGVLKSWAVPKGPSLVPGDKRLAVQVEDHPLDYAGFEGIIPAGEYGGGTVMVWDRGTWTPIGDPHAGLAKGALAFRLDGEKLRGRFRLVRLRPRSAKEKPSWLLMKGKDEEARTGGAQLVDERPESVLTGRDLGGVAAARERVWRSNRSNPTKGGAADARAVPGARKGALPLEPRAELATLVDAAPEGDGWIHEIKLDGYRLLARVGGGRVRLLTRNGNDWTERFPHLRDALAGLPCRAALLDGEAVVLDANGRSSFQALQSAIGEGRPDIVYFAFDLLHLDGYDLTGAPLVARKAALARLVADAGPVRYSDHVEGHGPAFFAEACRLGVEGIVSKERESRYVPGRGKAWLKVKCGQRQEMVVVGFTDPRGSRADLGALLLGVHDDAGRLVYAGKVGTGFSVATLADIRARLDRLATSAPAASGVPRAIARTARWVRPKLVAEVAFTEWTRDGHARHPVFMGLRDDKPASAVTYERAAEAPATVRLTHPDKILYPEDGITKRELADYYQAVADLLLPGLVGRPLSLVRCPSGTAGKCFYQKHATRTMPASLPRVSVNADEQPYVYVEDIGHVLELVQISVLELHVWGSRVDKLEHPDLLVMDLDPDPSIGFDRVVATARTIDARLRDLGLAGFPRLTGGKGLHVVVPLAPRAGWDKVREFSELLARELVRADPDGLTAIMSKSRRRGKIFVDYLRNARGATAIASYSTRARAGAPVAMPVTWDDLDDRAHAPPLFGLRDAPAWALARPRPWPDFEDARRPISAELVAKVR